MWAFKWWCKLNSSILHFKREKSKRTLPNRDTPLWFKLVLISRCHQYTYKYTKEYAHLMEIPPENFKTIFLKLLYHQQPFFWRTLCIHFQVLLQKHLTLYEHFPSARKFENVPQQFSPVSPWVPELFTPLHPWGSLNVGGKMEGSQNGECIFRVPQFAKNFRKCVLFFVSNAGEWRCKPRDFSGGPASGILRR